MWKCERMLLQTYQASNPNIPIEYIVNKSPDKFFLKDITLKVKLKFICFNFLIEPRWFLKSDFYKLMAINTHLAGSSWKKYCCSASTYLG